MTEKKAVNPHGWGVITNPVDPIEEAAKVLVAKLIADFSALNKTNPNAFRLCVEVPFWPENDKVVDRAVEIFTRKNWSADPFEHKCAGGRAGAFWLTPPNNWTPDAQAS
jgi:hypothetical protein